MILLRIVLSALAVALAVRPVSAADIADVVTEDVTRFTAYLASPVVARRIEGVKGLSHLKHWPAEPAILALLERDPAPALRREVLLALGRLGTAQSIPALIAALDSTDWETRENAALALERMTAHECEPATAENWRAWWGQSSLADKQKQLLAIATALHTNAPKADPGFVVRRGRRVRPLPASVSPPACPERREALRALRHLAGASAEPALLALLSAPQKPPLDVDERIFICEALERVGTSNAVPALAAQHLDAAAWALARIGGPAAEQALLRFPPTLFTLLALDRLHSTNATRLIPALVQNMGQITYRSQPDDVMNDEQQPIQRVGVKLIQRSGLAPAFIEAVLQQIEDTMQPPIAHAPRPACPPEWEPLFARMRSELKPGFVREDGTTTTQPLVTLCYMADDSALATRLLPLLKHPAFVVRIYVALTLGRLGATNSVQAMTSIINEGYTFSDSTTLASGKHFDQSQTVRWKGFLCMALGRIGNEQARAALEAYAGDPAQPRDIRYSSVVGLRFIRSPKSRATLQKVAADDLIWMVRDEARRACEEIDIAAAEAPHREARR
jgi:HEAT repeat protein